LWSDLLATHRRELPMRSEVLLKGDPTFRVRAVGAARQLPGCPDHARSGLPSERLERLCRGECYNPAEERRLVTRIEVLRILPQAAPDEDVSESIEDPWRTFPCSGDPLGCVVTFEERAWSSPIFVTSAGPRGATAREHGPP